MTIQDLVPDREICQEAQNKGVKIDSNFWWKKDENKPYLVLKNSRYFNSKGNIICPAPLTDEILEKLPEVIKKEGIIYRINIFKEDGVWFVKYYYCDGEVYLSRYSFEDKKLSNALLRLAIKLKEENII